MDRESLSRLSSSTTEGDVVFTPHHGNCMELIHDLYQKLEPQMSKSYRPNVNYVPNPVTDLKTVSNTDRTVSEKAQKGKPLKATQIVISAVSEMQKRRESTANQNQNSVKKKFEEMARRASEKSLADLNKDTSQSLPNLTNVAS